MSGRKSQKVKKIACFYELEAWEKDYFKKKLGKNIELRFFDFPLVEESAYSAKEAEFVGVFVFSKLDKPALEKMPRLRFIATMSTGFDHVDLDFCRKKGIVVSNVPSYGENTVAEHAFALLLAISRKIHKAWLKTSKGDFSLGGLRGWDLRGKTLGVVGTGKIGQHVIRIAKGFEMNVVGFDVFPNKKLEKELGFKYVSFSKLLGLCDVVSLHVPLSSKTRHLINKSTCKLFKKGAVLINTARGGLVDTHALVSALEEKILSGAGLDVLENEEVIKEEKELVYRKKRSLQEQQTLLDEHALLKFENVIVTPHCAFNSVEALERILDTTVSNIECFMIGKPQNKV